ncbi:MAG: trigger factor [Lachnospiraceae bacterium]|nr:trigger factor [Lachnospiraceae bacterium]
MSVKVEKLENNMAKLTIEVEADVFEKAVEGAYNKNKGRISIPGFRKGKAPRKMIEKMYGEEVFYDDAANAIIPTEYSKACDECGEEIVSSPDIEVTSIGAGKPFVFVATVALKPEVTLGKYKGIEVDKIEIAVSDEEVNAEIDREKEKNARTVEVTDRAVQSGDIATIDFEGFLDGVAFEGGKGKDYPLTIGSNSFIPGFEDALIGAEIGKECDVNVTFPEDYHAEELAGKPVVFKVTVNGIKTKEYPEVNDEFAAEVSEFETLDEYKEDIKKTLLQKKADDVKNAKEDAVIDSIIEDAKMDIPEAMVKTQQRQMFDEFAQRIRSQGLSIEQYLQYMGSDEDTFIEQMKPQAMKRIQSRLVLEAVVKAENITATDEEFESEVKVMAEAYQLEVEKVKELLGENGDKQVKEDICIKKAVELVVDSAVEK